MTAKPLTADQAASLRPQASPILDLFAQDCAGAILRLVRLHASRDETELRVRVDPDLLDRVVSLLSEAGYSTTTLGINPPSGRLIVEWPKKPAPEWDYGYRRFGPAFVRVNDDSEWTYRWKDFLAALGVQTAPRFQDIHPYPLLYERTRDLVAAQSPLITTR